MPWRIRANAARADGEKAVRARACSTVGGYVTPSVAPHDETAVRSASIGFAVRGSYSYTGANNIDPSAASPTGLSDEEHLQGLAFGGGLMYGGGAGFNLGLDYAYKYMGILGPTNFFSFSLGW